MSPEIEGLEPKLDELLGYFRRRETPAEPLAVQFDAAAGVFEVDDDKGMSPALSYGIYNPVKAKVYAALMGGGANATARSFVVPGRSFVVVPIQVTDNVRIGIDVEELGESSATIYRFKFASVQPAFAMLL